MEAVEPDGADEVNPPRQPEQPARARGRRGS
jgi:hypothetical protein